MFQQHLATLELLPLWIKTIDLHHSVDAILYVLQGAFKFFPYFCNSFFVQLKKWDGYCTNDTAQVLIPFIRFLLCFLISGISNTRGLYSVFTILFISWYYSISTALKIARNLYRSFSFKLFVYLPLGTTMPSDLTKFYLYY